MKAWKITVKRRRVKPIQLFHHSKMSVLNFNPVNPVKSEADYPDNYSGESAVLWVILLKQNSQNRVLLKLGIKHLNIE